MTHSELPPHIAEIEKRNERSEMEAETSFSLDVSIEDVRQLFKDRAALLAHIKALLAENARLKGIVRIEREAQARYAERAMQADIDRAAMSKRNQELAGKVARFEAESPDALLSAFPGLAPARLPTRDTIRQWFVENDPRHATLTPGRFADTFLKCCLALLQSPPAAEQRTVTEDVVEQCARVAEETVIGFVFADGDKPAYAARSAYDTTRTVIATAIRSLKGSANE